MLGASLKRFLQNPLRLTGALAADPVEAWIKFQDRYAERNERLRPIYRYEAEPDWERRMHELLGCAWPCAATAGFESLWAEVNASLRAKGIRPGPNGFGAWNDGDAGLVRAIWCLMLHLRPHTVVETGVGHGVTSRFVLEALAKNGAGHLSSVDVPPMDPELRRQVGMAVGGRHAEHWTYIQGSSRRRLPGLLSRLGQIDVFIHDSLHSARNVRFELDRAWNILRPGGVIVVDDIDANDGFYSFTKLFPVAASIVCEAEPLHPDLCRFNQKGLFGIIFKAPVLQ
jgi:Methyltransferase domain